MYKVESPCFRWFRLLYFVWAAVLVLFVPLGPLETLPRKIAQADLCIFCMNGGSTVQKKKKKWLNECELHFCKQCR